jgi:N-acylneuraminate cytidylyltransferase
MPRQSLPEVFWQTGEIDVVRAEVIRASASMTGQRVRPLLTEASGSLDIDSLEDWRQAERLLAEGEASLERLGFHPVEVDDGGHAAG